MNTDNFTEHFSWYPDKVIYLVIACLSIFSLIGFCSNQYVYGIIPIGLLIGLLFVLKMKWGYYITAFILPLSISIPLGIGTFNTPLEPFLVLLALSTLYHFVFTGFSTKLLLQPLSILILLFCACILISSSLSVQVFASFRIAIQTLLFIIASYFGVLFLSIKDVYLPVKLLATALLSFSITSIFNFLEHASYNFHRAYAAFVPEPFFSDHTIYATTAAFMIPIAFALMVWYLKQSDNRRYLFFIALIACISALLLSYSRGALVSVVIALGLYAIIRWKIRWYFIAFCFLCTLLLAFFLQDEILEQLKTNRADSKTFDANIEDQFKSITNVNNDLSNLERINRWNSALRMIADKPIFGFGHGMYQFEYFAYQKPSEMTYVSIRNPQANYADGTGGTAHSEYLLLSSENGIFTGLLYVTMLACGIILVLKATWKIESSTFPYVLLVGLGMSLTTYIVHSFFNNFLDTAQICFIFFSLLAAITSITISIKNQNNFL